MLFKVFRNNVSKPNQTLRCKASDCGASTREGKPYCPDHVDQNDYVKSLIAKLDAKDQEARKVVKKGQEVISNDSLTLREVVQELKFHGPRTIARLCRDTQLEKDVLVGYIDRLVREGRAEKFNTQRGCDSVRLVSSRRLYEATSSGRFTKVGSLTTSGRFRKIRSTSGRQMAAI